MGRGCIAKGTSNEEMKILHGAHREQFLGIMCFGLYWNLYFLYVVRSSQVFLFRINVSFFQLRTIVYLAVRLR
jgi:hypothetical protein